MARQRIIPRKLVLKQATWSMLDSRHRKCFHIKLDTAFDTIPQVYDGETKHTSLWQLKAGFLTSEKTSREPQAKSLKRSTHQQGKTIGDCTSANSTATSRYVFLARGRDITNRESLVSNAYI
jgi:hypothetical protein